VVGAAFGLEGGGPVLEQLLLPTVEHRRPQSKLVFTRSLRYLNG
jgi:hypothetical protein